eukprot:gb/GECH01010829.1/.p1 GENE.gb/GECH01010829.1/~~gb/GECH01010829.1/.p1  ORF type:complete len:436 (+),score=116.63 gb/GECH01010829.1/:1-1308(+)
MTSVEGRWTDINRILLREGALSLEGYSTEGAQERLKTCQVLVIGAGGLGCEILKNLALSGFKNIHVIDLDTIDVSNLNRQFLFRDKDVGQPKSKVAADFVMKRCPGVNIEAHHGKIQDFDEEYYRQFHVVISGLDAILPRRWINSMLLDIVDYDDDGNVDPDTIIPLIDGGTEGFKGQARVILPQLSSCFECTLHLFPDEPHNYQTCTIASTPRQPEHCIIYASEMLWEQEHGKGSRPDGDNPEHLKWIYERAAKRAEEFGIEGVTIKRTQGVVKRIIPAIASTNAIIAAACCNEAFKQVTGISPALDDWMTYNGNEGVYSYTYSNERNPNCLACGNPPPKPVSVNPKSTLRQLINILKADKSLSLKNPGFRCNNKSIYIPFVSSLEKATRKNLDKTVAELFEDGDTLEVTDPTVTFVISAVINFDSSAALDVEE